MFIFILLILLVCLFLAAGIYSGTSSIAVREYAVPVDNLPPEFIGFTILHLTDLHGKQYGQNQEKLLNLINQQEFDLIAITGDLVNKHNPLLAPVEELIEGLSSSEIYFVPGNHDHWAGYAGIKNSLLALDIRILENEAVRYTRGDSHLWLLGVDDPYLGLDRLDEAMKEATDSAPLILLSHAPNIFSAAVEEGIDLVLTGHTHGGQIRLPFPGAPFVPGQGLFPQYDYGIFSEGSTTMVINAGLDESGIPLRFYCQPEIVLITLVPR